MFYLLIIPTWQCPIDSTLMGCQTSPSSFSRCGLPHQSHLHTPCREQALVNLPPRGKSPGESQLPILRKDCPAKVSGQLDERWSDHTAPTPGASERNSCYYHSPTLLFLPPDKLQLTVLYPAATCLHPPHEYYMCKSFIFRCITEVSNTLSSSSQHSSSTKI